MHYAWSMTGYPTLFMSRSNDTTDCNKSISYNSTEYSSTQAFGSVKIAGATEDVFSFALVFTRIIEFEVKHEKAAGAFDPNLAFTNSSDYCSYWLNNSPFSFTSTTFHLTPNSSYLKSMDIKVSLGVVDTRSFRS